MVHNSTTPFHVFWKAAVGHPLRFLDHARPHRNLHHCLALLSRSWEAWQSPKLRQVRNPQPPFASKNPRSRLRVPERTARSASHAPPPSRSAHVRRRPRAPARGRARPATGAVAAASALAAFVSARGGTSGGSETWKGGACGTSILTEANSIYFQLHLCQLHPTSTTGSSELRRP